MFTLKKYRRSGTGTTQEGETTAFKWVTKEELISMKKDELDIPTLFADTIQTNTRSQHVLEKIGFTLIREDEDFKYYRIDRDRSQGTGHLV